VRLAQQVSEELLRRKPALVYLPLEEGFTHPETVEQCQKAGVPVAILLPRICPENETLQMEEQLGTLRKMGVEDVLAGNLGVARRAMQLGLWVRGDYGLGVYNSQTMKELKRLGFQSVTASFELKFPQIRDLSKALPTELIVYGRLPLMITENCIILNHTGNHDCQTPQQLTDRKGERFPVEKAWGCRNEIYNAKTLFLADKAGDWKKLGLWAGRLMFTTESPQECVKVMDRYLDRGNYQPGDMTRGLYYRDVE
jgi:putative protease